MPSPVPFLTYRPQRIEPVVLTCEHASNRLPRDFLSDPASRTLLKTHWGWDIGAWALTREVSARIGASAVGGRWSRLVVDLNRQVGDATLALTEADGVTLPWNRSLPPAEMERRVMEYHVPYHAEIDRLVVRRLVRGVRPFLLAIHSFTPFYGRRHRKFDAGVLYADHAELARMMARLLRRQDLDVRFNQPYSGLLGMMYAVDRHGSHHQLPCLEIEINQDQLANEAGVKRWAGLLAPVLRQVARAATA